jgi:translocation and assembly module TamB
LVLQASGAAQPFADPPTWELAPALTIPARTAGGAPPRAGERALVAGTLSSEVKLRGRSFADWVGTVALALHPESAHDPLLGDGRVDVTFDGGAARLKAALDVAGGRVSASGRVVQRGGEIAYAVDAGEVRGVDVAALLGSPEASRLDARWRLEGAGLSPAKMRASAHVGGFALQYGPNRLDAEAIDLELRDGRARATAAARLDGAELDLRAALASLDAPLSDGELHLAFRGLDFAKLTGDTTLASRLNGTVEARAQGPDLGALPGAWGQAPAPAGTRASLRLELEPSSWRGHEVSMFEVSSDLRDSDLGFQGRVESSLGRVRLAGTARPFASAPSLRLDPATIDDLDLGAWLGRTDLATRLKGNVRIVAATRDSSLALQAVLDGSSINRTTFDRLSAHARLVNGRLEAQVLGSSPTDLVDARLEGVLPDRTRPAESMRLSARGRLRIADLGGLLGRDSLEAGSDLLFDVETSQARNSGAAGLSGSGRIEGGGRFGHARIDSVRGAFTLAHGMLDVPRLEGPRRAWRSRARDAWHCRSPLRRLDVVQAHGAFRDSPVRAIARRALDGGSGRFAVQASGVRAATEVSGELHGAGVARDEIRADSLALSFQGTVRDTALAALDARVQVFSLVHAGLPPRDVDAHARWDGRELAVEGRAVVDESRWQALAFALMPGPERTRLRVDRIELARGTSRIELKKPSDITFGRTGFHVDDLVLLQNGATGLRVDGGIGADDRADLRFEVDSLEITDYLDLLGVSGLHGRMSLDAALTGTRGQPVVHGSWHGTVSVQKRPATLTGTFDWAAGELNGNASFVQRDGQDLVLSARLPLDLSLSPAAGQASVAARDRPMSWNLEARRFDLAWFGPLISPRVARDLRGELNGRIDAGGVPSAPDYQGEMVLGHARIQLASLGTGYDSDRLALGFSGRDFRLEPGVIRSGKGRVEVSGRIGLEAGRRTLELQARPQRFPLLNTSEITLQVSGRLGASGHVTAPRLTGALDVTNSTFYIEAGEGEHEVEKVVLTEQDLRTLETRFSETAGTGNPGGTALLDSLGVDVTAKIGAGVWVRRRSDPVLALELAGDVRFRKQPPESLTATGRLEIRTGRSYLSFLGRRFDLTRAQIELPGPIPDMSAEIEARYGSQASQSADAPDVTALVTVHSTGTSIDLRSVPYMDHASLINYLTTGQTQGEMAAGTAGGLAVGMALGAVGGAAGRSLGFQVVQVTQDAYGGQTLSAGNYVDPRIYLGFRQPVVQGRSTTGVTQGDTYTTEFEVELEAARRLLFNVQGGGTQYRFLLRPRLGK